MDLETYALMTVDVIEVGTFTVQCLASDDGRHFGYTIYRGGGDDASPDPIFLAAPYTDAPATAAKDAMQTLFCGVLDYHPAR